MALKQSLTRTLNPSLRIPLSEVADETVYRERRALLGALTSAPVLALSGCAAPQPPALPKVILTAEQKRTGCVTDDTLTRFDDITTYNNFHEFGTGRNDPSRAAQAKVTAPWSITVGGECARPGTLSLDDLLIGLTPEQRI